MTKKKRKEKKEERKVVVVGGGGDDSNLSVLKGEEPAVVEFKETFTFVKDTDMTFSLIFDFPHRYPKNCSRHRPFLNLGSVK